MNATLLQLIKIQVTWLRISGNLTLVSCDLTCYRPYSSGAPTFGAPPQPKKRLNEETTHIVTRHSKCVFVVVVGDHEHKDCAYRRKLH